MSQQIPVVAFVGLPNSGKSTLLNRLTGDRKAIVAKEAHTTRDLNYGEDYWDGFFIKFIDTGGLVPDPSDKIQKAVQVRSWSGIAESDLLVWVIDRKQDPETISFDILQRMWRTGKPFIVAINKVDDPNFDRSEADYAFMGGKGFVNMSCNNGYGLNDLMEAIVENLEKIGFERDYSKNILEIEEEQNLKKGKKIKIVEKSTEGDYYIVRNDEGKFESVSQLKETEEARIDFILCDLFGVLFNNKQNLNLEVVHFLLEQKARGKKLYYITNSSLDIFANHIQPDFLPDEFTIFDFFDGGLTAVEAKSYKPERKIYDLFLQKYNLEGEKGFYIDDSEANIDTGDRYGLLSCLFKEDTNLDKELAKAESKDFKIPQVMFLGKPNVGKSSLFNAFLGQEIQIVTDIAGTTMSVNDTLVERDQERRLEIKLQSQTKPIAISYTKKRKYILLDSVGVRKPGQRTFGPETFATYKTINTAHQADIICLVVDGSNPISHQDQVVAGIVKQAHKGLVVVVNKVDLVQPEQKRKFIRDFEAKFKFLKVDQFVWVSAKEALEEKKDHLLEPIWEAIDLAIDQRSMIISANNLRKLYNYMMKQKPPQKLRLAKRAVIYDLIQTRVNPPTFELLVKEKKRVHWSYLRFIENMLRKNYDFANTQIVVRMTEISGKKVLDY